MSSVSAMGFECMYLLNHPVCLSVLSYVHVCLAGLMSVWLLIRLSVSEPLVHVLVSVETVAVFTAGSASLCVTQVSVPFTSALFQSHAKQTKKSPDHMPRKRLGQHLHGCL